MEFKEPIKADDKLKSKVEVVSVQNKGKGSTVTIRVTTSDDKGSVKVVNEGTTFNRNATPKSDISGRTSTLALSKKDQERLNSKPDFSEKQGTTSNQAILYRLSGDLNPLHMYINRHETINKLVIHRWQKWQVSRSLFSMACALLVLLQSIL